MVGGCALNPVSGPSAGGTPETRAWTGVSSPTLTWTAAASLPVENSFSGKGHPGDAAVGRLCLRRGGSLPPSLSRRQLTSHCSAERQSFQTPDFTLSAFPCSCWMWVLWALYKFR